MQIKELFIKQCGDLRFFIVRECSSVSTPNILRRIFKDYYNEIVELKDFRYNVNGKPFLKNGKYFFNLSNSNNLTVTAISETPIGVDIQKIKDKNFLENYHGAREQQLVHRFLGKTSGNILLWCIKEAYVKYKGYGLSKSFSDLEIKGLCPIRIIDKGIQKKMRFLCKIINKEYILVVCTGE